MVVQVRICFPNLDDIFHADYLYLKDNSLVNRDEHVEFMRKEFTRKITVINPQFLYEDKDIMTYSYYIKVREKSYAVIQVQIWKDGKIWREMGNAVEVQKKLIFSSVFPNKNALL